MLMGWRILTNTSGHNGANFLSNAKQMGHSLWHNILLCHLFLGGHNGTVAALQSHRSDVFLSNGLKCIF